MSRWQGWVLERLADGDRILWTPTERQAFCVSLETLRGLGQMFLDEVEDDEELEDLREALYE